jgi:hypothetical protein
VKESEYKIQRRVAGYHDIRMDGMTDLVLRARGSSVFDIGCNRGLVSFEMANNGAAVCHGCDNFEQGIQTARELFADLRSVESQFEIVDLTGGQQAVSRAFGQKRYDIVLCLATYHKLKRIMSPGELSDLMISFGRRTQQFFGWRGTSDKPSENEAEIENLDRDLMSAGLKRVHTSYISEVLGVAAVWARR